jgi:hypothetical protein
MLSGPGRRFGKVTGIRKFLRKILRDLGECPKLRKRHGLENDLIIPLFDENFRAFEAKRLRQANGLAASMLEDFCGIHIYILYLFFFVSSCEDLVEFIEQLEKPEGGSSIRSKPRIIFEKV